MPSETDRKWTAGPWEWDEPANWQGLAARVYRRREGAFDPIAQVPMKGWPAKTARANAHLIASAPDLFDALEACVSSMRDLADVAGDVPEWNVGGHAYLAAQSARLALARARGERA